MTPGAHSPPRIALVTSGFEVGGGVPTVARWLRDALRSKNGYVVEVHDLATSSRDRRSRRLFEPKSWLRRSLQSRSGDEASVVHWGANAVEIEAMRYRPRRELTKTLQTYDLIQVVAGSPALASVAIGIRVPVVLQVATTVNRERQWHLAQQTGPRRIWRQSMTLLNARAERRALRAVDVVLVENAAMLALVRSAGQQRVIKAPPGVDTTLFSPAVAGWRRDGYLLSVCRLNDPRKGLERIICAYATLLQSHHSIPPLVVAGRGQLPASLSRALGTLGISSRVTVRSNVDPSDLVHMYRAASVFLQTSYEEGLGMSVLEAMACGLPVVCTDSAGTRETVIDGVTGWLVPQGTTQDVADLVARRILEVLRGDGAKMGARARERCETTFSTGVAIRPFTDVYADLLLRHRQNVPLQGLEP